MKSEQISKELFKAAIGAFILSFLLALIVTVIPDSFITNWLIAMSFLTVFVAIITLIATAINRYS